MDRSAPGQPLRDRAFTRIEIEQARLLLSTYCDGSGATNGAVPWTVPDYRAFERVVAAVCEGSTTEDKGVFDVVVPTAAGKPYGISCKMAGPGSPYDPESAFIEMSNSSKGFVDTFFRARVDWTLHPSEAGALAVELVLSWHGLVADSVDLSHSSYLLLTHSNDWRSYRLANFPLDLKLADPRTDVRWQVNRHRVTGRANSIFGYHSVDGAEHRLWELYPESGGQLKYRPLWSWAYWATEWFELEKPPIRDLMEQARLYFPALWVD